MRSALAAALLTSTLAFAQPGPPPGAGPGGPGRHMGPGGPGGHGPGGMGMHRGGMGIPPQVAQKLGISADLQKKVRDLGFEANEQLIGLEADLKRAQLDLEKYLTGAAVDEAPALAKLEAVTRAETAVKKNRMALMIKVRKTLGPDLWSRLEAEMPGHGPGMGMGMGPGMGKHGGACGPGCGHQP